MNQNTLLITEEIMWLHLVQECKTERTEQNVIAAKSGSATC